MTDEEKGAAVVTALGGSYAGEVTTSSCGGAYTSNAHRFATHEEARQNVTDLMMRWMAVTDTRVVKSADPVNATYIDRKLEMMPNA